MNKIQTNSNQMAHNFNKLLQSSTEKSITKNYKRKRKNKIQQKRLEKGETSYNNYRLKELDKSQINLQSNTTKIKCSKESQKSYSTTLTKAKNYENMHQKQHWCFVKPISQQLNGLSTRPMDFKALFQCLYITSRNWEMILNLQ